MDVLGNSLLLLFALFLVVLNGFFVAAEFAIVKLRGTRVAELRAANGLRGQMLARVHGNLDAYLSACQLGITLSSLGLGWVGEPAFASLLETPLALAGVTDPEAVHTIAFVVAFSIISYLHIVVGELAPKSMALRRPEATSLWTALPLFLFYWGMYPFIWVLNASANRVLRWFGLAAAGHGHDSYSQDELRMILHMNRAAAEGPHSEVNHWLSHALELPELTVGDLMRPWREVVALAADDEHLDLRRTFLQHRYSRYPLLDAEGEPVAVVHIKDALLIGASDGYSRRLREVSNELIRVHEDDPVLPLLREFRQGASHFAVVDDGFGTVLGFLTLEDIIEAMLGEIVDEHERERSSQVRRRIQRLRDGSLLARGDTALFRIERALGQSLDGSEDYNTLSGWLMAKLDQIPRAGDVVREEHWRFEVQAANGPRVERVRIHPV